MSSTVRMPEVLTGASEAIIQSWLVTKGQSISVGTPLAEVETDKAVVEYESEIAGTVLDLLVDEGKPVSVGDPIAVIGAVDGAAAGTASTADEEDRFRSPVQPAALVEIQTSLPTASESASSPPDAAPAAARLSATPLVRRLAQERDIDLAAVAGTGPGGRVTRRDLEAFLTSSRPDASSALPTMPVAAPDPVSPRPAESRLPSPVAAGAGYQAVPVTGMRRAIARRLTESKSTVPHFYVAADIHAGALLELRSRINAVGSVKVSVNDLVVKAAAHAFSRVPEANASWADSDIRHYESVDVSVAVAVEGGLLTPVLRGVERLSVAAVSNAVAELAGRARSGRLRQPELEGGCCTVSNLGMYGVKEFSAIINPPQASILAVGAVRPVPVAEDGEVVVRPVMTVTMSADHRVIDGALAARWLSAFTQLCENPLQILL